MSSSHWAVPPTWMVTTTYPAPSRAGRRSAVATTRAGDFAVSAIRLTSLSARESLSASTSMSTISLSPSSGKVRMSLVRFLVNTTLPAPMKTILIWTSNWLERERGERLHVAPAGAVRRRGRRQLGVARTAVDLRELLLAVFEAARCSEVLLGLCHAANTDEGRWVTRESRSTKAIAILAGDCPRWRAIAPRARTGCPEVECQSDDRPSVVDRA